MITWTKVNQVPLVGLGDVRPGPLAPPGSRAYVS